MYWFQTESGTVPPPLYSPHSEIEYHALVGLCGNGGSRICDMFRPVDL